MYKVMNPAQIIFVFRPAQLWNTIKEDGSFCGQKGPRMTRMPGAHEGDILVLKTGHIIAHHETEAVPVGAALLLSLYLCWKE